jgi:hypothetical protein
MRQKVRACVAAAFLIGLCGSLPASAEPITITSGQVVATLSAGSFQLTGADFSAAAGLPDGWSSTVARTCSPCSATAPVTLSFSSTCVSCVSSGSSGNVLGGTVFPGPTTFAVNFAFDGPSFSSSALTPQQLIFSAPFTMTGSLDAFTRLSDPNPPFFSTGLTGSGTATITFRADPGGLFDAANITYDFSPALSPTPEPGSLLLLGSGLVGLWRWRSRAHA